MIHHAIIKWVVVALDWPKPVAEHEVAVHQIIIDGGIEVISHIVHPLIIWDVEVAVDWLVSKLIMIQRRV